MQSSPVAKTAQEAVAGKPLADLEAWWDKGHIYRGPLDSADLFGGLMEKSLTGAGNCCRPAENST